MKFSRSSVLIGLGVTAALAVGVAARARESQLVGVVERARAELDISRPKAPEAEVIVALLDGLDGLLAKWPGKADTVAAPWMWPLTSDVALREALEPFGPFLAKVDEVLANTAVARSLETLHRVDRRTSLLWSRARTNILCAKAIVQARDGLDADAARRLGQALDLARVDCDPTSVDLMIDSALARIVFDALREMLAMERVDARILEAHLVRKLVSGAFAPTLKDCLRGDALAIATGNATRSGGASEPVTRWCSKDAALERLASLDDGSFVVQPAKVGLPESATEIEARLIRGFADAEVERLRRCEFARLALVIAAKHDRRGSWPTTLAEVGGLPVRLDDAHVSCIVLGDEARLSAGLSGPNGTIEVWTLR